ncbi:MFS general substrate transporter [Artomyces pyxidatus]|uniref:MFS general substrate transporter n=1 Tax=Artomyces pyxidatus TaxID=48021 RepID=A0ACB8T609_9AGAM|nr:MFS general substrate transporter [Artomyces pyxidatus]
MSSSGDVSLRDRDHGAPIDEKEIDLGAHFAAGDSEVLDAAEGIRIRRKIDKYLLSLMCVLYLVQFMDKNTLGYSAILGIRTSAHLTADEFNWLGTVFYLSYLLFEYPQNVALQRYPVGKWMSLNIYVWAIALICHAACKNFASLLIVRLILGICEGAITAGFMIVTGMFYTRAEQTVRVGYWFLMNGFGQIISGFISFGALYIHTKGFEPWQWLMVITGAITLLIATVFFFYFPDSPMNAWFLTPDERVKAVHRIKENQTGVENKKFKKEQMVEALLDPKTWLFALFAAVVTIPGSLINQRSIIVSSFGFNNLQTTLLGCVDGAIQIVTTYIGVQLAARIPNSIAWVGIAFFVPSILGVFLVNFLPWSDQVGLLCSVWLTEMTTPGFVLCLAWVSQTTAGHTKKIVTNGTMLSAYCIGEALGPFMWQAKYRPRNRVPWIIIGICYTACIFTTLGIRVLLKARNTRRDLNPVADSYEDVYIKKLNDDGELIEFKVDKEFLDLTDMQNGDFRYVL